MITIETPEPAKPTQYNDVSGLEDGRLYVDRTNDLFIYDLDQSALVYLGELNDGEGCILVDCSVSWPVRTAPIGTRVIIEQR